MRRAALEAARQKGNGQLPPFITGGRKPTLASAQGGEKQTPREEFGFDGNHLTPEEADAVRADVDRTVREQRSKGNNNHKNRK